MFFCWVLVNIVRLYNTCITVTNTEIFVSPYMLIFKIQCKSDLRNGRQEKCPDYVYAIHLCGYSVLVVMLKE